MSDDYLGLLADRVSLESRALFQKWIIQQKGFVAENKSYHLLLRCFEHWVLDYEIVPLLDFRPKLSSVSMDS